MCYPPATIENTIIAFNSGGDPIEGGDGPYNEAILTCCDIYGNLGGDWVGEIADQYGINGNFSADPLFCGPVAGSIPMIHAAASAYSLHANSPCLPGNHPDGCECGLIGAHGQGCGEVFDPIAKDTSTKNGVAAVMKLTWGRVKVGYRR
jgi:hypothetical protein